MQLAHHLLGSLLGVMVNSMSLEPDRGGVGSPALPHPVLCAIPLWVSVFSSAQWEE